VVEAQDAAVPSMAQDSLALAQDSWPPQLGASSVGHCSGVCTQSSHHAPPMCDGGQVVECGGSAVVLPLPQHGLKPPWDATSQISCSCGVLPPLPPLLSHCPYDVYPKTQSEVCFSFSGLVIGCYSICYRYCSGCFTLLLEY
jgi:hypothetical protein